jgi:hypothetical protein
MMDAMLETMQTPLKLDFSTGDAITPSEIAYSLPNAAAIPVTVEGPVLCGPTAVVKMRRARYLRRT